MSQVKKILIAGGTFSVALGIGFVMQNGDVLAARFASEPAVVTELAPPLAEPLAEMVPTPETLNAAVGTEADPAMAAPRTEPLIAAIAIPAPLQKPDVPAAPLRLAAVEADAPISDAMPSNPIVAQIECKPEMIARNGLAAMVTLEVSAPCNTDTAFLIHHQGMMISALTDAAGKANVTLPALAESAVFIAAFADGGSALATSVVPDVADYDRAVLQWQGQGDAGLQIHALENGASYGDAGHVWADAPRDAAVAVAGDGGFMVVLGDPRAFNPMMAEVYTYPVNVTAKDGRVDLSVEAEITSANCGRGVTAQSIQIVPGSAPQALDLTMTMPACDAVGDFLVLNTMFDDIQVAAR